MASTFTFCLLLTTTQLGNAVLMQEGSRTHEKVRLSTNPVRRVVTMLQNMQSKIAAEGERDQKIYDKFMCYCSKGSASLDTSIAAATENIAKLESTIKEGTAEVEQLAAAITEAKTSLAEANAAVADQKALRAKANEEYVKESTDMKTNLEAMTKAIAALEKGMGSSFLQTPMASRLRALSVTLDMTTVDRDALGSFLSTSQEEDHSATAPTAEIVGILKQMKDTMEKELADATAQEEKDVAETDAMLASKAKEIAALQQAIEVKTARKGELAVEIVDSKGDLKDTKAALSEDTAFKAKLATDCKKQEEAFALIKKTRAEETVALADTIKILNDDDALELFKKTLPSASLLQLKVSMQSVKQSALSVLKGKHDFRLNLIELALKGRKVDFGQVLGMIDDMVVLLGKEQAADAQKKAFCTKNIDETEDKIKSLDRTGSDIDKAIADHEEDIESLTEEIKGLAAGIADLDEQVKEATAIRKTEHEESVQTLANDSAAKELLAMAKNRLNKFYQPDLYKEGPPAFVQLTLRSRTQRELNLDSDSAPPAPPAKSLDAYKTKGAAGKGVLAMIDMLVKDLDKEIVEVGTAEKEAQEEYEELIKKSSEKRAADAKAMAAAESVKAEMEEKLLSLKSDKKSTMAKLMAEMEALKDLRADCDWLLQNFDVRKEARAGEVESLKQAKAVLSGADYSLLQTTRRHHVIA